MSGSDFMENKNEAKTLGFDQFAIIHDAVVSLPEDRRVPVLEAVAVLLNLDVNSNRASRNADRFLKCDQ